MAISLVGLTGDFRLHHASGETGINLDTFDLTYRPEEKTFVKDYKGEARGFGVTAVMSTIRITGEVAAKASAPYTTTFTAAMTFANTIDGFGQTAGGCYADEVEISNSREGWQRFSATYTRNAAIT